jgi:uridine kinase
MEVWGPEVPLVFDLKIYIQTRIKERFVGRMLEKLVKTTEDPEATKLMFMYQIARSMLSLE